MKVVQSCATLSDPMISDSEIPFSPWNSPGKNSGVGSLCVLQGIFPTEGLNPGLPNFRWILYQTSHKGSPRILEAGSFSLLQQIFPTQESNWDLLHCRWILYQMSYGLHSKKGKMKWLYKITDHNYTLFFLGINTIFSNDRVVEIHLLKLETREKNKNSY